MESASLTPCPSSNDDLSLTMRDPASADEERWLTLGRNALGAIIVVVYTRRKENARLISARPATAREKDQYEEHYET